MAENAIIKPISAEEVAKAQIEGNLPDKPNQATLYGGKTLTPQEVKAWYDKLPKLIVEYYNSLIKAIPGIEGGAISDNSLAAQILTNIREEHSLKQLFEDILTGAFADYLRVTEDITLTDLTKALLTQINAWGEQGPTEKTEGELGNLYAVIENGEITALYMCTGKADGKTQWTKARKELPAIAEADNGKVLAVEKGRFVLGDLGIEKIANRITDIENQPKKLSPPRIAAYADYLHIDQIPPEAQYIEIYDGGMTVGFAATNGDTTVDLLTPNANENQVIQVRVLADGFITSEYSNAVLYLTPPDFVSSRTSTARVSFPFKTFPLYDIVHGVKFSDFNEGLDEPIGKISEDGGKRGHPCIVLTSEDIPWWNKAVRFTRCRCDLSNGETLYPDEMVVNPFPNPYASTIEMWLSPTRISRIDEWGHWGQVIWESMSGPNAPYFKFVYGRAWNADTTLLRIESNDQKTGTKVKYYNLGDIRDGMWNHIVITQKTQGNNTETVIYSNGKRCAEYEQPPAANQEAGSLQSFYACQTATAAYSLGCPCGGGDKGFLGKFDSFAIYDYAWTEYQARSVYEAEKE